MSKYLIRIMILCFGFILSSSAIAEKSEEHKGTAVSEEYISEQGAEHGQSYAGEKEKKENDDKEKKDKKDKGDKEDKEKKDKKEKGDKDKKEKKKRNY